jgi:Ca2+-transporting ATPase
MTGDGVNDSPALKAADLGIALGRDSAEAAREVADVVLQTDDLLAMAVAVERGRATYTNVRKSIRYLLSTNLSEILVVLAATAIGIGEVLSPMQLLWINLISDVLPGLGLAFEAPEADAMRRGPRPADEPIVRRADLGRLAGEAAVIGAGALGACAYGVFRYGAASAQVRTLTFSSLVTAQLLHALTCRSASHGLFEAGNLPTNRTLTLTLVLSFLAQAGVFLVPGLRGALGLAPLRALDAIAVAAGGVAPYLVNEAIKSARLHSGAPCAEAPAALPNA